MVLGTSFTIAQMMSTDSLNVSKDEETIAQLKKLTKELDLTKEQQNEIKKLLKEESKLKSGTKNQKSLNLLQLLNYQQKETFLRLQEIDQKCESFLKSSSLLKSTQFPAQHSLVLNNASKIKDVRLLINNHPDGINSANTNYSTYSRVVMQAWTYSGETMYRRTAMKFILDDIPVGSDIVSATLYFYSDPTKTSSSDSDGNSQLSGSNAFYIERTTEDWDDLTVTWNTQPSSTTDGRMLIPASSSTTENIQIDLTDMVQTWINTPAMNYGVKLFLQTESHYRSRNYASMEHANVDIRPKLIIDYNEPPMPSTSTIEFTYDAAGNRIGRQVIVIPQLKSAKQSNSDQELLAPIQTNCNELDIIIYPNPTRGNVSLKFEGHFDFESVQYRVFNAAGRVVANGNLDASGLNPLPISHLPAGVYILTLQYGNDTKTVKLIKQ